MGDPAADKINAAVHACLDCCYQSSTPLKAIADYINQLDADPDWSQREIDQVETAVLKMLVKIAGRPPDDDGDLPGPIAPPHFSEFEQFPSASNDVDRTS